MVSCMFPGSKVAEDMSEVSQEYYAPLFECWCLYKYSDAMILPGLCRDLYIWVNDFLVFFGEVKLEYEDLHKAASELLSKTTQGM